MIKRADISKGKRYGYQNWHRFWSGKSIEKTTFIHLQIFFFL